MRRWFAVAGAALVLIAACAPLALRVLRERTIAKMRCVEVANSGELHVRDSGTPGRPVAALGHLDLSWTPAEARPGKLTPEHARKLASSVIGLLATGNDAFDDSYRMSLRVSSTVSVTCEGVSYSVAVTNSRVSSSLWGCREYASRIRCAKDWLIDTALGAKPSVVPMLDVAYSTADVLEAGGEVP